LSPTGDTGKAGLARPDDGGLAVESHDVVFSQAQAADGVCAFRPACGRCQFILLFVHRIRPYDAGVSHLIVSRSGDWSFPSDHATASFAIARAFILNGVRRRALAFFAAALLVCVSRVYVGTHYASDILGGAVTGMIAAGAARAFYWEGTLADRFITGIL